LTSTSTGRSALEPLVPAPRLTLELIFPPQSPKDLNKKRRRKKKKEEEEEKKE